MELETINKLYLELSQIATAKTAKEITLQDALSSILREPEDPDEPGITSMKMRLMAKEALRNT